jgi:DNA polymerase-1
MNTQKAPIYLIDAYGLIYRFYFAFISRPLRNSRGENVSALFGFARTISSLLNDGAPLADAQGNLLPERIRPNHLAVAFDAPGPTFRHQKYEAYKATRQKAPEDLHAQVPLVKQFLELLKIPILQVSGYEADDIIATIAEQCRREGRSCYTITSDKDLLQLVGDGIYQLRPGKSTLPQEGIALELVGPEQVKAEWGVPPTKVLDILSLIGDSSDNIPGVKGIGEKTAEKLMARYGSLDEIYKNLASIEGAIGKKLAEGRDMAYFSRSLIELCNTVPLSLSSLDDLAIHDLDTRSAAQYLLQQGMKQAALNLDPAAASGGPAGGTSRAGGGPAGGTSMTGGSPASGTSRSGIARMGTSGTGGSGTDNTGAGSTGTAPDDHTHSPAESSTPLTSPTGVSGPDSDSQAIPESLRKPGTYRTITDLEELQSVFKKAREQGFMALDFETNSLEAWEATVVGFSFALEAGTGFYVPVMAHRGTSPAINATQAREALQELLMDPDMTIVAHNAKYDYAVSRHWGIPPWASRIWDTMVAAWVQDPERGNYSLDSLITAYLGLNTTPYDEVVPKGSTFDTISLETAAAYSGEDADYTLRMKSLLEPRLQDMGCLDLFRNLEMPLLPILSEMEGRGIRIEAEVLRSYGKELAGQLRSIEQEIYNLVGHEFNIASTKQLQEVLFKERKLQASKKTKTGYSTDMAVLEELAREDPVPAYILRFRTLAKLKSTYVDTLADQAGSDGRIHTHFIQTGTATGRLSSKDPNLQNIPIRDEEGRRIRQAFVAEPGNVLISADYSQIELVVLAHLSQDPGLIEAFIKGQDVHRRTASLIFGVPEDQVSPEQRRIAKTINFGVMYGMSAFRLSNELGISRTDAQTFINTYFTTYKGIRSFIDDTIKETERTGYSQTILGRRRYIPTIASRNKTEKAAAERVAINTPIQGSAADIVKLAMIRLDKALRKSGSPAQMLLQVHDELILECPESHAEEAARLVKEEMEQAIVLRVPLRVSVETGKRWGDLH